MTSDYLTEYTYLISGNFFLFIKIYSIEENSVATT